ncbi:MAG: acyl carrier protein [Eubacterium sp.]|nr:acyl carrier protein [Eubacterium sp.]
MEFDALKKVTAKILGMDPDEIELDMTFQSDLGADSLDVYQIVMGVEDELDITIPVEPLAQIKTVQEAVELIKSVKQK